MDDQESRENQAKSPAREEYDEIADKVGLVPNLRGKDNLAQGVIVGSATAVGVVIGGLIGGMEGALVGALLGLVVSGFLTGFALMIIGWLR